MKTLDLIRDRSAFIKACHLINKYQLVKASSGNLSYYNPNHGYVLLSSSGSWLAEMKNKKISICSIDGVPFPHSPTPSIEKGLHLSLIKKRGAKAVLHFQSDYATLVACTDNRYDFDVIPEIPYYIKSISYVEFFRPGSEELVRAIEESTENSTLVVMKNHGIITYGKDLRDVIQKAVFFELACKIVIQKQGL